MARFHIHGVQCFSILLCCTVPAVFVGCTATPHTNQSHSLDALSNTEKQTLIAELKEITRTDQQYRRSVSWGTTDEAELTRLTSLDDDAQMQEMIRRHREGVTLSKSEEQHLMSLQTAIDRKNFARIVEITREFGYPHAARLGEQAPDITAVLIHAQIDDFTRERGLFHQEVLAGRMPAKQYAMMVDRALQHDGKAQLYGTAIPFDPAKGGIQPPPIESIEATNTARAEIGLPALTEYTIIAKQ
ncbi:MAG: hypothetical protein H6815_10790 [Phycisphaeraceae bacterium]|nr:hypothetical protein [Phycisphaeraceae bacterium]